MGIGAGTSAGVSGEQVLVEQLTQRVKAGTALTIFDVGANRGQFLSMLRAGLGGVQFCVHAFEPGQAAFEALSLAAGGLPEVTLNNLGLSSQAGEADLYADHPGSTLASLSKRSMDHLGIAYEHVEKIHLETLDAYCARQGVGQIDLLKLDVEGHELDVLQGGQEMFAGRRVGLVSFEFGGANLDARTCLRDFFNFFHQAGLRSIHRITPSGLLVPLGAYRESYEQYRTTNYLVCMDQN
jgi:FkbM family methyltransferase